MTATNVSVVLAASVVSCAIGAAGGYILTKKYVTDQYEGLIEEEVEKAKAFYTEHPPVSDIPIEDEEDAEDPVDKLMGQLGDKVIPKPFSKEDQTMYNKIALDYSAQDIPKVKSLAPNQGESMEEYEQRLIDEARAETQEVLAASEPDLAETLAEEGGEIVTKNIFDDHGPSSYNDLDRSHRDSSRPYIISDEEFEDGDLSYNQNTLTYYQADGVLTDERDQPVNTHFVVGDKNLQFGNASGDVNIVYVRNDKLSVDFEICQSFGSYAEEVLGVALPEDRRNKGQG